MQLLHKLHFYLRVLSQDMPERANSHYRQFRVMLDIVKHYSGEVRGKSILDIGCGRLYPYSLLFHSLGNRVVGIDLLYIGAGISPLRRYWTILHRNGLINFGREFLFSILLKNRAYYRELRRVCGFPLVSDGIRFIEMNVERMGFPDDTFDLAVSIAVFEHVSDVAEAVAELFRVLKGGGIAYINIHLFSSLSGGHHDKVDYTNPDRVPPWDHLRRRTRPLPCYLNEMREHQYLSLFQEKFEILEVLDIGKGEGEELLSPEIGAELSDYSEEELLKRGITIVARKPN